MQTAVYQDVQVSLYQGDCLDVLREFSDESLDAVVTDPPAGIGFMGKEWDSDKGGRDQWIAWLTKIMREVFRVMKPGAHALVWALPRTSGWTSRALEDAGFEVRDRVSHVFGSGFPKSKNVSEAVVDRLGAKRKVLGRRPGMIGSVHRVVTDEKGKRSSADAVPVTEAVTREAKEWDGFGTALKPAMEDWWLARRPLRETVSHSAISYGVGGLNIDASRVGDAGGPTGIGSDGSGLFGVGGSTVVPLDAGRWPANLVLSKCGPECGMTCTSDCSVALLDKQSGASRPTRTVVKPRGMGYAGSNEPVGGVAGHNDEGGASRFFHCFEPDADPFFYAPKPSRAERERGLKDAKIKEKTVGMLGMDETSDQVARFMKTVRNTHPTVKSQRLMQYLVKLVTPPGGTVLDCFAGSGSTLVAAKALGFRAIGVEREEEYCKIIAGRVAAIETREALRRPVSDRLRRLTEKKIDMRRSRK